MTAYGPIIGYILGLTALIAIGWIATRDSDRALAWILFVSGALFGWIVGILMTPQKSQLGAFSEYGTAIATFVSGYLFGKLDRILELKMADNAAAINPTFVKRLLIFVAAMILGLLSTFIWRTYVSGVAVK